MQDGWVQAVALGVDHTGNLRFRGGGAAPQHHGDFAIVQLHISAWGVEAHDFDQCLLDLIGILLALLQYL